MKITIDIIDRNFIQINEFCDFNKINIKDYIVQCVEDDFFTRKYGDLNEKLKQPKEEKSKEVKTENKLMQEKETKQVEEPPKVEKKKVGRPRKKVETPSIVEEPSKVTIKQTVVNEEPKTQTRTRRILKTR